MKNKTLGDLYVTYVSLFLFKELYSTSNKSIQHDRRVDIACLLQSLEKGKLNDDMAAVINDISKTISDHINSDNLDNLDSLLKEQIAAVLIASFPN